MQAKYEVQVVLEGGRTDGRKTNDRTDIWPKDTRRKGYLKPFDQIDTWPKDIQPKRQKAERQMTERQRADARHSKERAEIWPKRRLTFPQFPVCVDYFSISEGVFIVTYRA